MYICIDELYNYIKKYCKEGACLNINDKAKYIILIDSIKNDIISGKIKPGDKLPSENKLAEKFGMSRHTVRKALSILENDGYVSAEHGRGTFCTLKYKTKNDSKIIAVITTYISDYIFPHVINGIYDVMSKNGYNVLLKNTGNDIYTEKNCLDDALKAGVCGLIIEPSKSQIFCRHTELYERLDNEGIPYVFIQGLYSWATEKPYVITDDEKGGYFAVKHLIDLGHKKIIGIFKADDSQGYQRHKGFVKGLNEAGIAYNPDLIVWYHTEDKGIKPSSMINELINNDKDITAIVCYNDQIAISAIKELSKMGLSVPENISVIGFDNSDIAYETGLTSITHPKEELGKKSAEKLLSIINGEKVSGEIMDVDIVVRNSTRKL